MSEDLKPCPFCAGPAYLTDTKNGTSMRHVGCTSCGIVLKAAWVCLGPPDKYGWSRDVVTLWNRRTPASAQVVEGNAPDPTELDDAVDTLGRVTWLSSEEEGGPDVGLILGLGDGRSLFLGELPNATLEEHGVDPGHEGSGWWWMLYGKTAVDSAILGPASDTDDARQAFNTLEQIIRSLAASQAELTRLRAQPNTTKPDAGDGWRGIESANKDDTILASNGGKVWFQCDWDEDDGWVTFNRYLECDARQPDRKWTPTVWVPLPAAPSRTMRCD